MEFNTLAHWALPIAVAAFVWWFSTGAILLLDGLPRSSFRWTMGFASLLALVALAGLALTSNGTTTADAYVAFSCAIVVWGWQELAFLTGWITGPRKQACPQHCTGRAHFGHAVEAILYHEFAILVAGALIVALTWHTANPVGAWTYVVLWVMRTSAKLNLFFGVRNTGEELLPPHLDYLKSFFRSRRLNLLFPLSVTVPTAAVALMIEQALAPGTAEPMATGLLLVAALLGLAVLEHWLMVLPVPVTAMWRWALRARRRRDEARARGDADPLRLRIESLPALASAAPADATALPPPRTK